MNVFCWRKLEFLSVKADTLKPLSPEFSVRCGGWRADTCLRITATSLSADFLSLLLSHTFSGCTFVFKDCFLLIVWPLFLLLAEEMTCQSLVILTWFISSHSSFGLWIRSCKATRGCVCSLSMEGMWVCKKEEKLRTKILISCRKCT